MPYTYYADTTYEAYSYSGSTSAPYQLRLHLLTMTPHYGHVYHGYTHHDCTDEACPRDGALTLTLTLTLNPNPNPKPTR